MRRIDPDARSWIAVAVLLTATACTADLEPAARLVVQPAEARLGYPHLARFRMRWEPLRPLDRLHGRPLVFLHLVDARGRLVRILDHDLPGEWRPGSLQSYEVDVAQSAMDRPLPAGEYRLTAGLYDSSWGYRWPLQLDHDRRLGKREYVVATIRVEAETPARPEFAFHGGWLPRQPGPQTNRRRLKSEGALVVEAVTPGTVVLDVSVTGVGDAEPRVSYRCAGATGDRWLQAGRNRIDVPIHDPASTPCTIELVPATGAASETWLDSVSWYPTAAGTPVR